MFNSRLVSLYRSLDEKEIRALKKWLRSPLHNVNQEVMQLFDFLMTRRDFTTVTLQKKRAFRYVFGSLEYEDKKMRSLMNSSLRCLTEFVGYIHAVSSQFDQEKHLATSLVDRESFSLAQRSLDKMNVLLQQETYLNAAHFHRQYEWEVLRFDLAGTQERTAANNLPALFQNLSHSFVLSTLKYACIALSHSNVSNVTYEIPLLDAVLNYALSPEAQEVPAIRIFYAAFQALQGADLKTFRQLTADFFQYRTQLEEQEQVEVLLIALNVCIKQLNTGKEAFAREAFELYQIGLETGMLLEKNEISRFNYKNIVSIGLILQEFDWVEHFIEHYTAHLRPEFRETYRNFNTAKLHFTRGEYGLAKRFFTQVEYDDMYFNLSARMMLLKMHFEEGDLSALEALLDSFNRYLERKSVMGYHKQVYQNILAIVRQGLKLPPDDPSARIRLGEKIEQTHPLAERKWLKEQLLSL